MFTPEYIQQLKTVHADKSRQSGFGGKKKKLGQFHFYMEKWMPSTLLDYGCGKGFILEDLKNTYPNTQCFGYDPAVEEYKNIINDAFDCVFSNDVLEHIEPKFIDSVLEHINAVSLKYVWLRIDTMPARKKLTDGRNAHLIQENQEWWTNKINKFIQGEIVFSQLDKKGKLDFAIEK